MRYLIQYHNFEKNKGVLPGLGTEPGKRLSEITHCISSAKKSILFNSYNDTVFLILGIKFNKNENKKYFLWSKTIIKVFDRELDKEGYYNASGKQELMCPPPLLNRKLEFPEFLATLQNFRWGLKDISHLEFVKTLIQLSEKYKCEDPDQVTYEQHIVTFKERCKSYIIYKNPKKKIKKTTKKTRSKRARLIEGFSNNLY